MSASHWQQRLPLSGLHLRQRSLTPTVYSVRISKPWLFTWVWWPLLFECGKLTVFSDHSFYDGIWSLAKRNEEDCALGDRFLQSFDFDVIYIKGNTNFVAEYLLQLPLPTIQAMLCSIEIDWPTAQWADLMVTHSGQFTTVGSLRSLWGIAFYYAKPCTWADRPDTRKLLVNSIDLQTSVLHKCHYSPLAGHLKLAENQNTVGGGLLVATARTRLRDVCSVTSHLSIHKNRQQVPLLTELPLVIWRCKFKASLTISSCVWVLYLCSYG
jgi:hypothetical protein